MLRTLRLSLAQTTSAATHGGNVATLDDLARRAAADGAHMLALPEVAGLCERDREKALLQVVRHEADPFVRAARAAARRHGLWIHTGSTPVVGPDGAEDGGPLFLNRSDLIDAEGRSVTHYDKIHLFDVFLDGRPPTGESRRYAAGDRAVLADTPWGPMGLTICYDLRFPGLYRDLAAAGAGLLFVPSAFTVPTGRAHWEVLLRARAIETGAFVVAPAQVGLHEDGRRTYGHTLAVNPWGEVLADLGGDGPGLVTVELDLSEVEAARRQIPSLGGGRPYRLERAGRSRDAGN